MWSPFVKSQWDFFYCLDLYWTVTWCQLLVHTVHFQMMKHASYNNWFPCLFRKSIKCLKWMFLHVFEVKLLIWSALEIEFFELYSLQPVLSGHPVLSSHLAIPRGNCLIQVWLYWFNGIICLHTINYIIILPIQYFILLLSM